MKFEQVLGYLKDSVMVRRSSWNSDITVGLHQPFEAGLPAKPSFFVTSKVCSDIYIPTQADGNAIDWEVPAIEVWWWPINEPMPIEVLIKIEANGNAFLIGDTSFYSSGHIVWFYTKTEKFCYILPQQDGL